MNGLSYAAMLGGMLCAALAACHEPEPPARAFQTHASAEELGRWPVSGCTTDTDCEAMESFVSVVCANEGKAECDAVVALMYFRD